MGFTTLTRFFRVRLNRRLLLVVLLVSVPGMIVGPLLLGHVAADRLRGAATERLSATASALAARTDEWAEEAARDLVFLASRPELISMDPQRQRPVMLEAMRIYKNFTYLHTIGPDGRNVARSDDKAPIDYSDRAYFRHVMAGAPIAQETLSKSRSTGRPALNQAAPILGPTGRPVGVLVVGMDLNTLSTVVGTARQGTTGYSCLIDSQGYALAHPNLRLDSVPLNLSDLPPVRAILAHSALRDHDFTDAHGVRWLVYTAPVRHGWTALSLQQESEVLAQAHAMALQAMIVMAATTVVLILLVWIATRHIVAPMRSMTELADRIAAGSPGLQMPIDRSDELGDLARAFNYMHSSLDHARDLADHLRLRTEYILNAAGDGIMGVDAEGCIAFMNPAAAKLFGWETDEYIGLALHPLTHHTRPDGSLYPPESCPFYEVIRTGTPCRLAGEVFWRKDGSHFTGECTASPLRREDQIVGAVLMIRDITDREQLHDALELERNRLLALLRLNDMSGAALQDITDFVLEEGVRLTGSSIGYLAFMNDDETVLTMHSWSRSAMAACAIIAKPIVYQVAQTGLWGQAVRERRPVITNDYQAPHPAKKGLPAGHVHVTRHMNIPVFDGDRIVAVAGVGNKSTDYDDTDVQQLQLLMNGLWRITRQRQTDEAVGQARIQAEAATRVKSEFLANMSHEIRTPMTAIMGYVDGLLDPDQTVTERAEATAIISRNCEHLLSLVNDILDISKIEAGKMRVERIACSPAQIISEAASLMRLRTSEKQLQLAVQVEGPLPQTIQSDPTRLRQILINLLSNAIKFTKQGGVTLRVNMLEAPAHPDPHLQFRVIDSGIGMDQSQLESLFQPFTQADNTTTRRFGGTGLGLAISKHLTEMLGGTLTAISQPGGGSTFTLTVQTGPLNEVPMTDDFHEALAPHAGACPAASIRLQGRLLLAEDGPDNQRLIAAYLRRAGADVTVADNGLEACVLVAEAAAAGQSFDLILMDMQMPEVDGYSATATLRAQGFTGPIIALTANAMAEDRVKCLGAGCSDYLTKPVKRDHLLSTVARHLTAPPPESPAAAPLAVDTFSETLRSECALDPEVEQFLPMFVAGLPEKLTKLAAALAQSDLTELERVLHQIKGTGGLYGFPTITQFAAHAEQACRDGHELAQVAQEVAALVEMVRRVEGYDPSLELVASAPGGQP